MTGRKAQGRDTSRTQSGEGDFWKALSKYKEETNRKHNAEVNKEIPGDP